jgi:putative endonuclease
MYKVYILSSSIKKRYYIGYTNDLVERLKSHNSGNVKSTKAYRPRQVIYTEDFVDKGSAFRRERQIKSYKGGNAFIRLLGK